MTELKAINSGDHSKKVWKHATDYTFAADQTVISLVGAELSKAALAMPTGFVKLDAGYQLVAITSLQPGTNLFVAPSGRWLVEYIPATLRGYPFQLAQQEGAGELILCINEASGLVVENTEDGNAFFDDQGQPTQAIKGIRDFLSAIKASWDVTEGAVNALADAGLITPWKINLKQGEKIVPVEGLFSVDEAVLNKLDNQDFLTLRKAGGLALAYAQLLSMNQLTVLERLGGLQDKIAAKQTAQSEAANLTGFSLSEDEGSLMFD